MNKTKYGAQRHNNPKAKVGWRVGGGGVGGSAGGGGKVGGGGLCATHYYHMHTSRGDVCLGAWGSGGMYVIIALSRLCLDISC